MEKDILWDVLFYLENKEGLQSRLDSENVYH